MKALKRKVLFKSTINSETITLKIAFLSTVPLNVFLLQQTGVFFWGGDSQTIKKDRFDSRSMKEPMKRCTNLCIRSKQDMPIHTSVWHLRLLPPDPNLRVRSCDLTRRPWLLCWLNRECRSE